MTKAGIPFFVFFAILLVARCLLAGDSPSGTESDIEARIEAVLTQSGSKYLSARTQLLSLPFDEVETHLRKAKEQTGAPLESLLLDALLIRLKDQQEDDEVVAMVKAGGEASVRPVQRTVRLKVEFSLEQAMWWAVQPKPTRSLRPKESSQSPDPRTAARVLIHHLDDGVLPIVAELLCKGLADDWVPWKREMLIGTVGSFGWNPSEKDAQRALTIKDPRGGWLALWFIEHEPDETLAKKAAQYLASLSSYPDAKLLGHARRLRDRAKNDERRAILAEAVGRIESGIRRLETERARQQCKSETKPSPSRLEVTLSSLRANSGEAYLAARAQLLSLPCDAVETRLRKAKKQVEDPLESLVLDALLIRLKDQQEDDEVLPTRREQGMVLPGGPVRCRVRSKVDFAIDEARLWAGYDHGPDMRRPTQEGDPPVRFPDSGSARLVRHLGDDALPIAAEMLYKELSSDWEPWEREMLIGTIKAFGWNPHEKDPLRALTIKDSRGGWLALWFIEHERDETLARKALGYLSVPDAKLLEQAKKLRDGTKNAERRAILSEAAARIESGIRRLEAKRARFKLESETKPSSQPSG